MTRKVSVRLRKDGGAGPATVQTGVRTVAVLERPKLRIHLVDDDGRSLPGEMYTLEPKESPPRVAVTDGDGRLVEGGLSFQEHRFAFDHLYPGAWQVSDNAGHVDHDPTFTMLRPGDYTVTYREPVFDYAFVRDGDDIRLEFSTLPDVSPPFHVRLYEASSRHERQARRALIRRDAAQQADSPGYRKSGGYHRMEPDESLSDIVAKYGHGEPGLVRSHPANRALESFFSGVYPAGARVYVPQLHTPDAISLGGLLAADPIPDAQGSLPRFAARWSIPESGYDVLHPCRWLPEDYLGDDGTLLDTIGEPVTESTYVLPHFAVLDRELRVLGVSPSAPELVQALDYEDHTSASRAALVLLDGEARVLPAPRGAEALTPEQAALYFLTTRARA